MSLKIGTWHGMLHWRITHQIRRGGVFGGGDVSISWFLFNLLISSRLCSYAVCWFYNTYVLSSVLSHKRFPNSLHELQFCLFPFIISNFVYFCNLSVGSNFVYFSPWTPILSFFLVLKPHFCLFLSMRHCHMMWDLPFCTNISLWFVIFISSWVCSSACIFFLYISSELPFWVEYSKFGLYWILKTVILKEIVCLFVKLCFENRYILLGLIDFQIVKRIKVKNSQIWKLNFAAVQACKSLKKKKPF